MEDAEKSGSPFPRPGILALSPSTDPNLVAFSLSPPDPLDPMNWSNSRKWIAVGAICLSAFTVTLSSSIFTDAVPLTAAQFHVSSEVMILSISLYVFGFAAGPLLWAPLSEAFGRRRPFMAAYLLFVLLQIPVALAPNPAAVLISRFFGGTCGSATLSIPPAMSVDFLAPVPRSKAVGLYMASIFVGTVTGPIAGAWIVENERMGWCWTAWIVLIIAAVTAIFAFLAIPESCAEILLQRKAAKLRRETQNKALYARRDEDPVTWDALRTIYFMRPARMIVQEPILLVMTIYNCLVYGLLYLIFFAYPFCFQVVRGWSVGIASLPFLAMLVGILLSFVGMGAFHNGWWARRFQANGQTLNPEDRIPPMAVSAILLPAGLFWFAWTSWPHIHWAPQVLAGVFISAGIMLNMLSSASYLIDVYLLRSNSALAANVCLRSAAGGAFPLFANYMYARLGSEWATSLLAFLCLAMAPVPWGFWKYGKTLRGWSRSRVGQ